MRPAASRREVRAAAGLIAASLLAALIAGEALLRLLPVPGVHLVASRPDPEVGYTLLPGASVLHRSAGATVVRRANSLGYLDREPPAARTPGRRRIAFYGDSFVEARQVPLAQTFFRRVEAARVRDVETQAFGLSGYGTLAALLTSRRIAERFAPDLDVYVFCENDPGDNVREIRREPSFPSAVVEGGRLLVRPPERPARTGRAGLALRRALNRSWLLSTVVDRVRLLRTRGARLRGGEGARTMGTAHEGPEPPDQNDLPSSWPPRWRAEAERVAEGLLIAWAEEARAAGRGFAVLYVPREGELEKGERQDSWRPWLEPFCRANGIAFVDPTPEFLALQRAGRAAFADHLTAAGHEAFAEAFLKRLDAASGQVAELDGDERARTLGR